VAIQIEWRLTPNPQHAGSAELRGPANTPFLYVHPRDNSGPPRRSSSARWVYNHQDLAQASEIAAAFTILTAGWVSFTRYLASRARYAALMFPPEPWEGQASANQVYTAAPVTGFQPSAQANYQAYITVVPAAACSTQVTLIAALRTWSFGHASQPGRIGMGQSIASHASAVSGATAIVDIRSLVRLGRWPWFKRAGIATAYNVLIPPGGEVQIGSVSVGPAYEIRGGTSLFGASSYIGYTVAAVVPLG
jgi:hypothetical protein